MTVTFQSHSQTIHIQKLEIKGQSVRKISWKQTDGQTNALRSRLTLHVSTVALQTRNQAVIRRAVHASSSSTAATAARDREGFRNDVTLTSDLRVNACRVLVINYTWTKFRADSSIHFSFRQSDRQTDRQTHTVRDAIDNSNPRTGVG